MKVLFDKVKNKNVDEYWINNSGEIFINSNPFGVTMNSSISICLANNSRYELRDYVCPNEHCFEGVTGVVYGEEQFCHICRDLYETTISIIRRE